MSKLKELKQSPKQKSGFDFTYVVLGAAGILVLAVVYFAFFSGTPPANNSDIADDDPFLGPSDAKVTVVEFSDFQCPACGATFPVVKQVQEEYGDRIKFVYRDFPLTSIHPFAQKAAEAAECADEQGKFWEYHDILFQNQTALAISDLKQYAGGLGLNQSEFDSCLDNGEFAIEVARDAAAAQSLGAPGTPTFFINGVRYKSMTFSQFKTILDQELAKQ